MDRKRSNRERSERRAAVSRPSTALPLMKPDKKSKALWEAGREEEFHSDNKKNKTTKDELQIKRPTDEQTHMHMDTDTLIWIHLFCQSVYSCGTDTDETSKTHQLS